MDARVEPAHDDRAIPLVLRFTIFLLAGCFVGQSNGAKIAIRNRGNFVRAVSRLSESRKTPAVSVR
jgi:hypothetical protein